MTSARLLLATLLLCATTAQAVDWGRLIHGAPPKAPAPKQLAVVSLAPGVAGDPNIEAFRDASPMLSRLSERYAVDGVGDRAKSPDVFAQAVEQIPGPSELAVQAIERRGDEATAKVEVRYPAAAAKQKTFRFDAAGRLLWSDLFAVQVRANGP